MAFMLIVDNPGGRMFAPFNHADWNGFTPTDFVFPTFVFVMGVSMFLSLRKQEFKLSWKVLKRFVLLLGIGWGGVCFWNVIPNRFLLAVVALLCGCLLVTAFLFMFRKLMKLESNGAFDIHEAVGQVATVYIRIPADRSGQGKVQVSFGGSVQELPALTDGEAIPSGAQVRIAGLIGNKVMLVEKI